MLPFIIIFRIQTTNSSVLNNQYRDQMINFHFLEILFTNFNCLYLWSFLIMLINNFRPRFLIPIFFLLIFISFFLICHNFISTPHCNFIKMLFFIILLLILCKSLFTNYKLFLNFIQFIKSMSKSRCPYSSFLFIKLLI